MLKRGLSALFILSCLNPGFGLVRPLVVNRERGLSNVRAGLHLRRLGERSMAICAAPTSVMDSVGSIATKALSFGSTVWDFSRPHTVVGSLFSGVALFMFACPGQWGSALLWQKLLPTLAPALLMNLYITGLNQLTDVDIDKINKPYLPVAAGALKHSHGTAIVAGSLLMSLFLSRTASWPMKFVLLGSCILGSLYSLPPFRLKRFPLLAAFSIFVVRGALVNIGFFLEAKLQVVGVREIVNEGILAACVRFPEVVALATFFSLFGIVIAVIKDVPDVRGDKMYAIPSFSVQFGARTAFHFGWNLLVALLGGSGISFLGSIALSKNPIVALGLQRVVARTVLGIALSVMAVSVRRMSLKVDAEDPKAVFANYMVLWNYFYGCYGLLPLAAL